MDRNIFDACRRADKNLLLELLEADEHLVDAQDDHGLTALALVSSAKSGSEYEMCIELLKAGANPSIPDFENGWNPLHRALYFRNLKVALLLIKAGAALEDVGTDKEESRNYRVPVSSIKKDKSKSLQGTASCRSNIDHEGLSPLGLLSLCLSDQLREATEDMMCTSVYTFGKADFQLGLPLASQKTFVSKAKSIDTLDFQGIVAIDAATWHSVALTNKGEVYTWGHGKYGRLGHGDESTIPYPQVLKSLSGIIISQIVVAENHCLAIRNNGDIYGWGSNKYGQLGLGSDKTNSSAVPLHIKALKKHVIIGAAAAHHHSVAFSDTGELWLWGSNERGQLGQKFTGSGSIAWSPKQLWIGTKKVQTRIFQVSAGVFCTLVLRERPHANDKDLNMVLSSGATLNNDRLNKQTTEVFQLGHGNFAPMRVSFSTEQGRKPAVESTAARHSRIHGCNTRRAINIIQLSAGTYHNVALSSNHHVYTWGSPAESLGYAPGEEHSRDTNCGRLVTSLLPENGGAHIRQVCAGSNRTCAISVTGDLYTWGATEVTKQGVLGHGKGSSYQPLPKRVLGVKRAVHVAIGDDHTMVLTAASVPPLPLQDQTVFTEKGLVSKSARGRADSIRLSLHRSRSHSLASVGSDLANRSRSNSAYELIDLDEYLGFEEDNETKKEHDVDESDVVCGKGGRRSRSDSLNSLFEETSILQETAAYRDGTEINFNEVPSLSNLCEHSIAKAINVKSVVPTLIFSEIADAPLLYSFCTKFIEQNLDAVLVHTKQEDLNELLLGVSFPEVYEGRGSVTKSTASRTGGVTNGLDNNRSPSQPYASASPQMSRNNMKNSLISSPEDRSSPVDSMQRPHVDLSSIESVSKRIRALKKKLKFAEELEEREKSSYDRNSIEAESQDSEKDMAKDKIKGLLTEEQRSKVARKIQYEKELNQLDLVLFRLEGEARVKAQATKVKDSQEEPKTPKTEIVTTTKKSTDGIERFSLAGSKGKGMGSGKSSKGVLKGQPPSFGVWTSSITSATAATAAATSTAIYPDSSPSISSVDLTSGATVLSPPRSQEGHLTNGGDVDRNSHSQYRRDAGTADGTSSELTSPSSRSLEVPSNFTPAKLSSAFRGTFLRSNSNANTETMTHVPGSVSLHAESCMGSNDIWTPSKDKHSSVVDNTSENQDSQANFKVASRHRTPRTGVAIMQKDRESEYGDCVADSAVDDTADATLPKGFKVLRGKGNDKRGNRYDVPSGTDHVRSNGIISDDSSVCNSKENMVSLAAYLTPSKGHKDNVNLDKAWTNSPSPWKTVQTRGENREMNSASTYDGSDSEGASMSASGRTIEEFSVAALQREETHLRDCEEDTARRIAENRWHVSLTYCEGVKTLVPSIISSIDGTKAALGLVPDFESIAREQIQEGLDAQKARESNDDVKNRRLQSKQASSGENKTIKGKKSSSNDRKQEHKRAGKCGNVHGNSGGREMKKSPQEKEKTSRGAKIVEIEKSSGDGNEKSKAAGLAGPGRDTKGAHEDKPGSAQCKQKKQQKQQQKQQQSSSNSPMLTSGLPASSLKATAAVFVPSLASLSCSS